MVRNSNTSREICSQMFDARLSASRPVMDETVESDVLQKVEPCAKRLCSITKNEVTRLCTSCHLDQRNVALVGPRFDGKIFNQSGITLNKNILKDKK